MLDTRIFFAKSEDDGETWSEPEIMDRSPFHVPTPITGVRSQPASSVLQLDGRIAMVYVDRTGPPVIKKGISSDRGRNWPDNTEIVLHQTSPGSQTWNKKSMQDAWAEMGEFSLGLPTSTLLENGDVLFVYYSGPHTDQTDIKRVRIRTNG